MSLSVPYLLQEKTKPISLTLGTLSEGGEEGGRGGERGKGDDRGGEGGR